MVKHDEVLCQYIFYYSYAHYFGKIWINKCAVTGEKARCTLTARMKVMCDLIIVYKNVLLVFLRHYKIYSPQVA